MLATRSARPACTIHERVSRRAPVRSYRSSGQRAAADPDLRQHPARDPRRRRPARRPAALRPARSPPISASLGPRPCSPSISWPPKAISPRSRARARSSPASCPTIAPARTSPRAARPGSTRRSRAGAQRWPQSPTAAQKIGRPAAPVSHRHAGARSLSHPAVDAARQPPIEDRSRWRSSTTATRRVSIRCARRLPTTCAARAARRASPIR